MFAIELSSFFELFAYYFSMVPAGFSCTVEVVVYDVVLVVN